MAVTQVRPRLPIEPSLPLPARERDKDDVLYAVWLLPPPEDWD
jgi:hypothetical protein